jgi:hypothetical protein
MVGVASLALGLLAPTLGGFALALRLSKLLSQVLTLRGSGLVSMPPSSSSSGHRICG